MSSISRQDEVKRNGVHPSASTGKPQATGGPGKEPGTVNLLFSLCLERPSRPLPKAETQREMVFVPLEETGFRLELSTWLGFERQVYQE